MAGGAHVFDMIRRINQNRNAASSRRSRRVGPDNAFHPHVRAIEPTIVRLIRLGLRVVFVFGLISAFVWIVNLFW